MSDRPSNRVIWFGVLGGPLAWAVQFVAGYAFGIAQCQPPTARWNLAVHSWQAALAAAALVVGLVATAVCLRVFLRTRGPDNAVFEAVAHGDTTAEPLGRVHFLATIGLTVNPLAIAIIVMSGIGAPLLPLCQQS